ncbi:MAG: hypothetical protein ABJE95_14810 [Byssovorax sp.]
MLYEFLAANAPEILSRTRAKVAARTTPVPTEDQLKNGVPLFLSQLIARLSVATIDSAAIETSAALHGGELLAMGFTVSQVVHAYGDVCQVITQLANETSAPITAEEFQLFHRCLDEAMAHSVTEYQRRRDASVASEETARLGALASELGSRLDDAELASTYLRRGNAAIGGSAGAVIGRSLRRMGSLVTGALGSVAGEEHARQAETGRATSSDLAVAPVAPGLDDAAE